jgi:hypothetical protein
LATSTWERRELPILVAIGQFEQGQRADLDSVALSQQLGLERRDTVVAVLALVEAGYIQCKILGSIRADRVLLVAPRLKEPARRAIGQWPTDSYSSLLATLTARIEVESDPGTRTRLESLRDAVLGVGRDVGTSLLTSWLRDVAALP